MRNKFPRANDPTQTCRYVAVRQVETSRDVSSKVAVTGEPATADFGGDEPSEGVSEHLIKNKVSLFWCPRVGHSVPIVDMRAFPGRNLMKKAIGVLGVLCMAFAGGYFALGKWTIKHETLIFFDAKRHRSVAVDLAVRWDYEMNAGAGYEKLWLAIISQGNTVRNTEYSFLANVFAARGYLVASIQHDLPTDAPLITREGSLYVGRLGVYERAEANILFAMNELKKIQPNAEYDHITLIGHSNGGDISMFFAQQHPELVREVVTLDNLRVPFVTDGRLKILSFRSKDPNYKTDPGVLPGDKLAKDTGIDIVKTGAQHTDMSDRGPGSVKEGIETTLDNFLSGDTARGLGRKDANRPIVVDPQAMGP